MNTIKFPALVGVAILVGGVFASAFAQKAITPAPVGPPTFIVDPLSGTYTIKVDANEVSAGDTEYAVGKTYGWTAYGTTSGDLSGYIFISLNYSLPSVGAQPSKARLSRPQPITQTSDVTGGSWSKLIFVKGRYVGSVHGRIVGGTLEWNQSDLNATLRLQLVGENGTGSFVDNTGKGTFEGTLDRTSSKVPNVTGVLTLNY
jgi:hypothetical protein